MGTGGLTPPGRHSRRATMNRQSTSGIPNNSYGGGGISSGGGYGGGVGGGYGGAPNANTTRSMSGAMSNKDVGMNPPASASTAALGAGLSASAPLMSGGGVGDTSAGSHQTGPTGADPEDSDGYAYKAKALYACESNNPILTCLLLTFKPNSNLDTASADDPNEISFAKGEILEILDNAGQREVTSVLLKSSFTHPFMP